MRDFATAALAVFPILFVCGLLYLAACAVVWLRDRFRATFPPHSDYTGIGDKGRGWRS